MTSKSFGREFADGQGPAYVGIAADEGDEAGCLSQGMSISAFEMALSNAIEQSTDAVAITDVEGWSNGGPRFLYVNRAFERMTGYSSAEVIGKTAGILHGPKTDQKALERIRRGLQRCESVREEVVSYRKDGTKFMADLAIMPVADAAGCFRYCVATQRDATDVYMLRQLLLLAKEGAGMATFDVNVETDEGIWSDGCFAMFGLSPASPPPSPEQILEMCHPEDRAKMKDQLALLAAGIPIHFEHRILRPGGQVRWLETSSRPILDADGAVCCYLGVGFDITERKQAMEALRVSEERLRIAQKMAGIGTFDIDLVTGERTWSAETFRIFGLEKGDSHPKLHELMHGTHSDLQTFLEDQVNWVKDGMSVGPEYQITHPSGEMRWVEVSGKVIKNDCGEAVRYLGSIQDITERKRWEMMRKRSEEQLRAFAARLQEAIEAERQRIARELHDQLGQALTGLRMNLDWLFNTSGNQSGKWIENAQDSMRAIDTTIELVRRLSSELRPQLLDAVGLPAAIEWESAQFEKRSGVQCHVDLDEAELHLTQEQEIAAFRIFQESMTNVIRHAHAKHVTVKLMRTAEAVTLSIEDDGVGISTDSFKKEQGLGLLGMRERANLLGARLEIGGSAGEGTKVVLSIPIGIAN